MPTNKTGKTGKQEGHTPVLCSDCDIDGYGRHAPRCPSALEEINKEMLEALRYALVQIEQDNKERGVPSNCRKTEDIVREAIAGCEQSR